MNPELLDMAGGDPYRAQALYRLISKLADGPDTVLREMATGVLRGDLRLRDAASSEIYSEPIADRFDHFWQGYQTLTPEGRSALVADGHRFIEQSAPPQPDGRTS